MEIATKTRSRPRAADSAPVAEAVREGTARIVGVAEAATAMVAEEVSVVAETGATTVPATAVAEVGTVTANAQVIAAAEVVAKVEDTATNHGNTT